MKRCLMVLFAVCLTASLARVAAAQDALGNGRMLDNNLQQGSGGYNAPQAIDTRLNSGNAIVTGNVSGLGYFHGNVGYSAPGEFAAPLAGDSLFRFRAQSFNPVVGMTPIPQAAQGYSASPMVELYRSNAAMSAQGAAYSTVRVDPGSGIRVYRPTYALSGAPLGTAQQGGSLLGYVQGQTGLTQVSASPLLGIRQEPLDATAQYGLPTAQQQRQAIGAWLPMEYEQQTGQTPQLAPSAAIQGSVAPSMALGSELQARLGGRVGDESSTANQQSIQELQRQLLAPAPQEQQSPAREPTAYVNLLRRLRQERQQQAQAPGTAAEALQRQEQRILRPQQPQEQPPPEEATHLAPTIELRPPTTEEEGKAQMAREQAVRRSLGLPAVQPPQQPQQPQQRQARQPAPQTGAKPRAFALPPEFTKILERLNYDMPPVASMAGQGQGALAEAYRTAEAEMTKGQYFPALDQYRQIQQRWPQEAMAAVGQLNAAMGAGMIRTSALTLRRLLEQHPELIAVRYEPRLLPSQQRLQWVRDQLDQMIASTNTPDAALLLAYLGYQSRSEQLTRYGLDLAQAVAPQDPLLVLLRQIWLHNADRGSQATPQQAPAPNPGPSGGDVR